MRPIRRPLLAITAAVLLAGGTSLAWAPAAEACMAARQQPFRPGVTKPVPVGLIDQAGAKVLLAQDGDQVACHMQVQYYGDAADFGMVIPTPTLPTVGIGSEELFTALRDATRPDFALARRTEGTCKTESSGGGLFGPAAAPASRVGASKPSAPNAGVAIVAQSEVGPYDATVLKAENADSLRKWLEDNQYVVPAKLDQAVTAYVDAQAYFVAVKLQKDRSAGEIQPLVLRYQADKPGVPVRLASVSAVPDMDVYMWVLGASRAVPDNYEHVEINEARLDWFNDGDNYRQVVTAAMDEAGGRAWATDFAGKSSAVKLPAELKRRAELDTISLSAKTNGADFVAHVKSQRYFPQASAELAFLTRHVAGYAGMAADNTALRASADNTALRATAVDTAKAMKELHDSFIQPAKDAQRLFSEHPYLTQLYTTLSPDEMTIDPTVVFTTEMGDVTNHHKAEAITLCSDQYYVDKAPVRIKLPNGQTWLAEEGTPSGGGGAGASVKLPAARRVMRCGLGAPRTITDNFGDITKTLQNLFSQRLVLRVRTNAGQTPRDGAGTSFLVSFGLESPSGGSGGFGCLGCSQTNTPPLSTGSGEGLAYALVFLGFAGYRRWLGRVGK